MTRNKYRLLFAEDDLLEAPYLVVPFEKVGFVVDKATTGLEAFTLIKERDYDAVVLDNMMAPGGGEGCEWSYESTGEGMRTGLLVLRKMAELDKQPPVWVLTALADTAVESEEEGSSPVVDYIKKDCSLLGLARKIRDYLDSGGMSQ